MKGKTILMFIVTVIVIAIMTVGIVLLAKSCSGHPSQPGPRVDADNFKQVNVCLSLE